VPSPCDFRESAQPHDAVFESVVSYFETLIGELRADGGQISAAIVDRLTYDAHIIQTGTDSYRLRTPKARHQAGNH
jgi:DNA replication protein DnaC